MARGKKQARIKLDIHMPSLALLRFIEKSLQDDKFFESAVDDPLATLKESGVRLDVETCSPSDLGTFFSALAEVKDLIKKKQIKEISFEKIFGPPAVIHGANLMITTHRGMWTQFNKNALVDTEMFRAVNTNFEALRDSKLSTLATTDLKTSSLRDRDLVQLAQTRFELDMAGKTESYKETDRGTTFHFDADKGVGSSKESKIDTHTTKSFPKEGIGSLEEMLIGPLINPADLITIAAQLTTYVKVVEQTGGGL